MLSRFLFSKCSCFAARQQLLSVDPAEELNQFGDEPSPPGLVACSKARAVVSPEVPLKTEHNPFSEDQSGISPYHGTTAGCHSHLAERFDSAD
jgi:hypothetical protein